MAVVYTRVYKVPMWVIIERSVNKKRRDIIIEGLVEGGAKVQEWPAQTYPAFLLTYRQKGYATHLPEKYPYNLDTNLLLRSVSDHLKNVIKSTSNLSGAFRSPAHYLQRKVTGKKDFEPLFNNVLMAEDDMGLSQVFQIAEQCYTEGKKNSKVWVTVGPVPKQLLTRIANKVITISDEPGSDICVGGIETKEALNEALNNYFTKKD